MDFSNFPPDPDAAQYALWKSFGAKSKKKKEEKEKNPSTF